MISYLARRLVVAVLTFLLATIIVFFIIELPPGDYVDNYLAASGGQSAQSASVRENLREYYGLDKPFHMRYFSWVGNVIKGDLGYSLRYNTPVINVLSSEIWMTLLVMALSFAFAWTVGLIIGIYSATHQYSLADNIFTTLGFLGLSIPNFFLAMVLIFILLETGTGITGGFFSNEFAMSPWSWGKFVDFLKHLWIPIVAIGTARSVEVMRFMRGNLLEVLSKPYVNSARSKGLRESKVVLKHSVRVAINPLISLAGIQAPRLISGIIVTAMVLNLPVMGPTFVRALKAQDVFLAGAYLLVMVVLLLVGDILADLALAWSDPRIRYS